MEWRLWHGLLPEATLCKRTIRPFATSEARVCKVRFTSILGQWFMSTVTPSARAFGRFFVDDAELHPDHLGQGVDAQGFMDNPPAW
jgi:hypothetical protein